MHYVAHLSRDKKLAALIQKQGAYVLKKERNIALTLMETIMSQQLNTKVAATFQKRFLALYNVKNPPPEEVLQTSFETLRSIGLSNQKARYILNVAEFFVKEKNVDSKVRKMNNEEVVNYITQIKGVGRWTTEMLLMFTLGREDVFPIDDYGIQMAMKKLYRLNDDNKKAFREKLIKIAAKWAPYQTYACMHLWNWKDTKE